MSWFIDDVPLSTLAFNVSNRAAGWRMPAKRGDNLEIPGRHGARWLPNKPFEQGSVSLSMWAIGALEDGSMPLNRDAASLCRQNLDKLTSLFSQSHKLLNIVQIDGNAFGAWNAMPNPGFEGPGPTYWTYQNVVRNPMMRALTPTAQISNLFANPALVTTQQPLWQKNYENLFLDPLHKLDRPGARASPGGGNYFVPASFESYAAGASIGSLWSTAANTQAAVQGNTGGDQAANPRGGTRVFRVLTTAALGANITLGTKPAMFITPGYKPLCRLRMRRSQTSTNTRTVQVRMISCTSNGTSVNVGPWTPITLPPRAEGQDWTDANVDPTGVFVDGTNATHVRLDFRTGEAWASGDGFIMDMGMLNVGNYGIDGSFWDGKAGPYYDGNSTWGNTVWGTEGDQLSVARWHVSPDSRWVAEPPSNANSAYWATAEEPYTDPNGTSLNFIAYGFVAGAPQSYTCNLADPTAGESYSPRISARAVNGTTCVLTMQKKSQTDADWVTVSTLSFVGTGAATASGSLFNGTVNQYVLPAYTADVGDKLRLRITVPTRADGNPILQLTNVCVTNRAGQFNGDSLSTVNSQYSWEGQAYNSRSIHAQRRPKRITSSRSALVSTTIPTGETVPVNTVEVISPADGKQIPLVLENITIPSTNRGLFIRCDAAASASDSTLDTPAPSMRMTAQLLDANGAVVNTFDSAATPLQQLGTGNTVTFTPVGLIIAPESIPTSVVSVRVSFAMVNPLRTQGMQIANIGIFTSSTRPSQLGLPSDYFDGSDGGTWAGTANDSVSEYRISFPAAYQVPMGVPVASGGILAGRSVSNTPTVGLAFPYVGAAGRYFVGLEAQARLEAGGTINANSPITVTLQFRNGNTVVSSFDLGIITGNDTTRIPLQGSCQVAGSFTEVRVVYTGAAGSVLTGKIASWFIYPDSAGCPVMRISWNQTPNPYFTDGLAFWSVSGTAPVPVTTTKGAGYRLGSDTRLTSTSWAVTAGQALQMGVYGTNGTQTAVQWRQNGTWGASTAILTNNTPSHSAVFQRITVPAGADQMRLVVSGVANSEISNLYVGADFATHEDAGFYDFTRYAYFDGTYRSKTDLYGQPTVWLGTPDNSASAVLPTLPVGWVSTLSSTGPNLHAIVAGAAPLPLPPTSVGKLGAAPRIAKGTTQAYRITGIARGTNQFLSGEISVAHGAGMSARVAIYGATTATASGTQLFEQAITNPSGQTVRWLDLNISAYEFFYLQVTYSEASNAPGYRLRLDNVMLLPSTVRLGVDYPGYFDGDSPGGAWDGEPGASTSTYYGGGRRCYAEVVDAIDMTSMAGGTRAEFVVDANIPSSFWEDLIESVVSVSASAPGTFDLGQLAGTTAPIDDAVITLQATGTVTDLRLTDVATGAWLQISGALPTTATVVNNSTFTVRNGSTSLIKRMRRGGSNQLLPVTAMSAGTAPKLALSWTGSGSVAARVTARRRYMIA